jgi:hypothetical protein
MTSKSCRFLDPEIIRKIPLADYANRTTSKTNTEGWVWTYLKACLATEIGYEEARAVVREVQNSMDAKEAVVTDVSWLDIRGVLDECF